MPTTVRSKKLLVSLQEKINQCKENTLPHEVFKTYQVVMESVFQMPYEELVSKALAPVQRDMALEGHSNKTTSTCSADHARKCLHNLIAIM